MRSPPSATSGACGLIERAARNAAYEAHQTAAKSTVHVTSDGAKTTQDGHLYPPATQAIASNPHNGASHPRVRHSAINDARRCARGCRLRMAGVLDRFRSPAWCRRDGRMTGLRRPCHTPKSIMNADLARCGHFVVPLQWRLVWRMPEVHTRDRFVLVNRFNCRIWKQRIAVFCDP